ncbi:hypothetical protein IFM89_005274 [Coptis chinensis]|uniref:Uncharacterized protein n=1 Tax=Coptis chinensis TaxID=261450 RepID=A0A835MBR0_9MAGN|nr:hypothetical protein IFM89_005274 [Coptis chinensis]
MSQNQFPSLGTFQSAISTSSRVHTHIFHSVSMHPLPSGTMDLKLTMKRCSTLIPWNDTERRTMFLSDLEQYLNFNIGTISFFSASSNFPPETVLAKLEKAYRKALVYYDYLAGRLKINTQQGRLEIDCNSAGAGFVVISSELALAELGDLVSSIPAFLQLETMRPEKCLFVIQVILFQCGGFAITTCMNHVTFDGWSLKMFLHDLTYLFANDNLLISPYNDRQPLSIPSPSHLTFPHLKDLDLELAPKGHESDLTSFQVKSLELETKIFRFEPNDIINLKEKAVKDGSKDYTGGAGISRFKVITAHTWRCKALARNAGKDPEKKSAIHYPVDIRPRLKCPQLPPSYTGNATIDVNWKATCRELEEKPFPELVEMVSNASSEITEEYIKRIIDSGEWLSGFPHGDVIVSSWMNLGFEDVEYPWGKPKCVCPLVLSDWNDIIILFRENKCDGRANILVTLPHEEMDKFQSLFQMFMEKP